MSLRSKLLDLLMPRKCVFCGKPWESDLPCPTCQQELPWLLETAAERQVEFISLTVAALAYQGGVQRAIRGLKFQRRPGYVRTLGPLVADCARDRLTGRFDLITWVPVSKATLRRRGFDQAELLAGYVGRAFGMEPVSLFVKKRGVPQQSRAKNYMERRANALGAFRLARPELAAGRRVLIVDDVTSTGATLSECARLLRMAGCEDVCAVTLAAPISRKQV